MSFIDKTVKLWKVSQSYEYTCRAAESHHLGKNAYPFPARSDPVTFATPRRIFQNAHAYNINSIAINSDQETFLSCDDLRINLWKLDQSDVCFTLVDIKPQKMEELSEVITACRYHPSHCHSLAYSTSKGAIRLVDTRTSLLCDQPAATLEETEDPANKSYYSEVIASISDINYDPSGRHIVARDYLSLKVWDTHMPSKPVLTIPVQEYLRPYLADLYDTDCILDQFEAMYSADGTKIVTGTYSNQFYVFDARSGEKEQSVSLPAAVSGGYGYDESGRNSKEIRIPKAKIKGVAETRADQKVRVFAYYLHTICMLFMYIC